MSRYHRRRQHHLLRRRQRLHDRRTGQPATLGDQRRDRCPGDPKYFLGFWSGRAYRALNDRVLLFAADDGSGHGQELWESDGTAAGTKMVKDLNPGPAGSLSPNDTDSGAILKTPSRWSMERLLQLPTTKPIGRELWKSDGTADGTTLVDDIDPAAASSSPQSLTKT